MATVASKISFYQFASFLEKLCRLTGDIKKKNLLKSFIKQWREFELKLRSAGDGDDNDSFFPALRFLLPQLDKDREAYGIKEYTFAKLFIKVFGLGPKSPSALNLINYKNPKSSKDGLASNDFATVAYHVLKDRCPEKGILSIADINKELDSVAAGYATKDQDMVQRSLLHLMKNVSSQELKWLVRIILKEMKMGMGQRSIFNCYHNDAEEVYNVKMSLEKVCLTLRDPEIRLHEIEVSLFSPFRPMLAQRGSLDDVEASMKGQPYFVEVKYDGERMQLHMADGKFKYFSRGGLDYTQTYGEDRNHGNMTPHIFKQFKPSTQSCILDGEMVGYNPDDGTIGSKGENFDIKSAHLEKYQPMYVVFDILLLNGKVMSNIPLRARRETLMGVVRELPGRILISKALERNTNQECIDALNEAIDKREEGIMIKDPGSVYKPNCRNKGGWHKIKPEYIVGQSDDLDLIVVGGYFGERSPMITHFLCAVAVDPTEGENPKEFHTFSKVGSGYNNEQLKELNQKLSNDWLPFQKSRPPNWLKFPSGFKQKPDVVLGDPSKSIIFQVKAAEIIQSDQYKTGMTLRFPRVVKIRYDKPWYDCMTIEQLEQLQKKYDGKLTGMHVTSGQSKGKSTSRKRTTTQLKPSVDKRFRGIEQENVEKTSAVFAGKEFCIVSGDDKTNKSNLEELAVKNGGSIVQNPGDETFCTVAGKMTLKVNNIIKVGNRDVVKSEWLLRCDRCQQLLPWLPTDMIHATPKTKQSLADNYDCYGDSFYEDTSEEALRDVFDNMNVDDNDILSREQIAELESKYFGDEGNIFGMFRTYKAHFQTPESLSSVLFRFYGGLVSTCPDDDGDNEYDTDVLIIATNGQLVDGLPAVRKVISEQWVQDSIDAGKVLNEKTYLLKLCQVQE